VPLELAEQPRLADAGFAADEDCGAGALRLSAPERFLQQRELAFAPDEPFEADQRGRGSLPR